MRRAERGVLVGIVVAVAAALRWGFVATAQVQSPLRADAGQYAQYGKNLVEHGIYSLSNAVPPDPDSFRSPGYPLMLALCRCVAGEAGWYSLAIGLQVVLGTATVWLVHRLARAWLPFGPALAAAALTALSPHLVVASAYVLTECVTTFLLVAAFAVLGGARSRRSVAGAGLLLGGAAMCNETLLFVPVVLAWPLLRVAGGRLTLLFLCLAVAPSACWSVRNAAQHLQRTSGERITASISHGSYPGMVWRDPRLVGFPYHEDPEQPAFGASWPGLLAVLGRRVAEAPLRHVRWFLLEKPIWLWGWDLVQGRDVLVYEVANSPYERQPVMAATHWLMRIAHVPLMVVGAAAAAAFAWNRRRRWPLPAQALGLAAVFGTLAYLPVVPDPRYLQPFRPLIFVLSAAGLSTVGALVVRRLRGARPEAAPGAAVLRAAEGQGIPPAT